MIDLGSAVVTGIGAVSAAGCGIDATRSAFESGRVERRPVDRSAGYHLSRSARTAFLVDDDEPTSLIGARAARRMGRPSKFAVAAARLAYAHAGLDQAGHPHPLAVILSTSYGPPGVSEQLTRQILLEGPEATSPALFTESVANAPAAQIALALGARGPSLTITQRQAGPLLALARAAASVASGRAEAVLVGAVDEATPLLHSVLDRFRALARPGREHDEAPRPFDARRDGFVLGEGSAVLVVESEASASRRGARGLARAKLAGRAFDPSAPPAGWGREPRALAVALRRDLDSARVPLESIDGIVSGACGSRGGDRLEALVLTEVWGDRPLPPVFAPKAYLGEHGGALLAGAVLLLSGVVPAATPGFAEVDPELALTPWDGGGSSGPTRLLVTSHAAGGAGSWVVLEKWSR